MTSMRAFIHLLQTCLWFVLHVSSSSSWCLTRRPHAVLLLYQCKHLIVICIIVMITVSLSLKGLAQVILHSVAHSLVTRGLQVPAWILHSPTHPSLQQSVCMCVAMIRVTCWQRCVALLLELAFPGAHLDAVFVTIVSGGCDGILGEAETRCCCSSTRTPAQEVMPVLKASVRG